MADDADIGSKLNTIFARILGLDEVRLEPGTTAADVEGWDSVTHVQLMVAIEKEFAMRFRTGEMARFTNVGQLVECIASRGRLAPASER